MVCCFALWMLSQYQNWVLFWNIYHLRCLIVIEALLYMFRKLQTVVKTLHCLRTYQSIQSDGSHQKAQYVEGAILIQERPLIIEFCDVTAEYDKANKQSFIVPWRKHLPLLLAGCWWVFGGQYGNALLMIPFPPFFWLSISVANSAYLIWLQLQNSIATFKIQK